MAVEYAFRYRRQSGADWTSTARQTAARYREDFLCTVKDDADSGFDPRNVKTFDVAAQTWLPTVGKSAWTDGTKVDPWSICQSKTVQRDARRLDLFTGSLTWQSPSFIAVCEDDLYPVTIEASVDQYGSLWAPSFEIDRSEVLYEDFTTPTAKRCALPTGTYYSDPFFETLAARSYVVTQLEDGIQEADIINRLGHVNDPDYLGNPAGWWLISAMAVQRAIVPITTDARHETFVVQYTLKLNPIRPWWTRRALIDTVYLEDPAKKEERTEFTSKTGGSFIEGLITDTGEKKADQNAVPDYETYRDLKTADFNQFMTGRINPIP